MLNRSFRAPEKEMPAPVPVKQRQQKHKEDEPGLFLEMKKQEQERLEFDSSVGSTIENGHVLSMASAMTVRKTGPDEFLNSENDKNDYDWLLTPPGTPLFPSVETVSQNTVMCQYGGHKAQPSAVKSRVSNTQQESTVRNNLVSRPRAASPGPGAGSRRLSSTGAAGAGAGLRSSTPTSRPALGTQSRAISNSVTKNQPTTNVVKPRSSTPTSRPLLSSSKPAASSRSSTPTNRPSLSTTRSSTPTSRPSLSTTKPAPRTPTPPRRSPTLSTVTKTTHSTVTNSASSPNARPKPWNPQQMPGYTFEAPPNLRTSINDRPISSMIRGRAGAPSSRSSSIEPLPNGRVRRQSCSPSRGRLPTGVSRKGGGSVPVPSLARAYAKATDNMTPGLYGSQMVERVVNMRKLAPPRQDDKHSPNSNHSGKSSSPDSSGFGRSLSKKSLDMAMRHMDIRRTLPGNLRPLMTRIPASSMYSVRTGPARGQKVSVSSDSPVASSSNASSEMSVNNNPTDAHIDDESNIEMGVHSSASIRGR